MSLTNLFVLNSRNTRFTIRSPQKLGRLFAVVQIGCCLDAARWYDVITLKTIVLSVVYSLSAKDVQISQSVCL